MREQEQKAPFIKGDPVVRTIVEFGSRFIVREQLTGRENLEEARKLLEQGKLKWMMGNHLSNLDGPFTLGAIRRAGFADLMDNTVYLMGLKMQNEWFSRLCSSGYNRIDIWPTSIEAKTEEEKRQRHEVIRNAVKSVPKTLEQGGVIWIYPEGGRSRTGNLRKANPQIVGYLNKDHYILPVGIWGTEKALPVGERFPQFLSKARINIGKPFQVGEVLQSIGNVSRKDFKEAVIDGIMRDYIAPLVPLEYQGEYLQQ